jgi:hypothetical protein
MKKNILKLHLITFIMLFFNVNFIFPLSYYISSSGNDLNNGTSSSTPWKTITKVNSIFGSLNPGDQILFNKGDTFFGTLNVTVQGTPGNEIVISSYGTGSLPVITGKKRITGWVHHSGNIYKKVTSDTVYQIYIEDNLMRIARFPNTGFLKIDAGNGNNGFLDADLVQSSGYWVGSNCRIRTANYSYETKLVSAFSGGNITFSSPTQFTGGQNYGYYLDNKLSLLDSENEWYQDLTTGTLYFYAPGGVNPDNIIVDAVVKKNCVVVTVNKHNLKFKDLKISGCREIGLDAFTSNNVTIKDCYFNHTGKYGLRLNGLNDLIDHNIFEDNLNDGLTANMTNGQIINNEINRNGLIAGYGENGTGYFGMQINSSQRTLVMNNTVDSSGYSGICVGKSSIIKNNIVSYSCLVLNDGAGIDLTYLPDSLQILNNIVSNSIGNMESSANPSSYAHGIYVNGTAFKNCIIQNNTVYSCRCVGIAIDHSTTTVNNKIIGNLMYNNYVSQMIFMDYSASSFVPIYNTIIKNNILYCLQSTQICMEQRNYPSVNYADFGFFDSNYYCNPYNEFVFRRTIFQPSFNSNYYMLSQWKTNFNEDLNSKSLPFAFEQYKITDTLSSNLVINSRFTNNVSSWTSWPVGATISQTTHPMLDTGCMKIQWTGEGYTQGMIMTNPMTITRGNYYLASWSAVGNNSGSFNIWGLAQSYTNAFFFPRKFFSYENFRKEYSFLFKADTTDVNSKFAFSLVLPDSILYTDNVNLYKVNVEKLDSSQMSKLFVNETSGVQTFSLNGIPYKNLEGVPVTGSISIQPYSSAILINENSVSTKTLELKAYIEGIYNEITNVLTGDTVRVYLRNSSAPFSLKDSSVAVLNTDGNSSLFFINGSNSIDYYLVISHRNSLETWSSIPVSFNNNYMEYDFSVSAGKAYGNNQVLKGSSYCIYSGDVMKNGSIDLDDYVTVYNDAGNYVTGYSRSDLNGNAIVDLEDLIICINNAGNFISKQSP